MSTEINLIPKFVDKAMSPVAESVGNSIANIWDLVFGNHIKLWKQKQEFKHQKNYQDYVERVNNKISEIPIESLVEPSLHIIGPAIEASKFYIDSIELREMFANLIAASMNENMVDTIHPSYVEIIKQISPDEAKLLKFMHGGNYPFYNVYSLQGGNQKITLMRYFSIIGFQAGCQNPENITVYLDNLNRLGLIQLDSTRFIADHSQYVEIEENTFFKEAIEHLSLFDDKIEKHKGFIESTLYGINFYKSCIE
ncbi:DUF4393 domain-containing protein [Lysinibacillus capsici]|uniref:DUF4393 domain-containing protein n=1 Tax=Lysinibacillus capsici TaxID=2115968 RepID=UPI003BABF6F5